MKFARLALIVAIVVSVTAVLVLPLGEAKQAPKQRIGQSKPVVTRNLGETAPKAGSLVPFVGKAVGFGVTRKIKDLPTPQLVSGVNIVSEATERTLFRSLTPDALLTQKAFAKSADAALQSSAPEPNIAATITNFEGQTQQDVLSVHAFRVLPPDTTGDVGPNHYVQAVNLNYRVYDKTGAPLTPSRKLSDIWASLPGPCATRNDGYPTVLYDSYADRWFITQFCTVANPNNHQLIAVSQTSDPTGAFFVYDFILPNNKFNDFPRFGVWPNAYYMSNNQFNQAGTAFQGTGAYAFDRAKILAGDPSASYIYFDLFLDPSIFSMLPSDADGLTPPPANAPNIFSRFVSNEFGAAFDGLRLFDFYADFAFPANSTFLERAESPVAVAAFDPRDPPGIDDIEQPPPANNSTAALSAISDRLMHRLQYRNFGTHQSLVTNHTVNVGTGTTQLLHQAGVRYYELRNTGAGYAVNEQATFAPDATNRWMGSAAMDHEGNLAVGYTVSSTTIFPGIRYAGRLAADPPNGLFQGEAVLQAGGFVQTSTNSRWGDYSSTTVDPTDDCTFWHTNEYYATDDPATNAEWHTRVGSFKVNPSCVAPAQGTLTVNVTNCDSALPVQGASITVDGNLFGTTLADGSFSSKLAPGSYGVVVSGAAYFPVTVPPVTITNGSTSTINVCVTGAPGVTTGGTTITAENCPPADNALSPSETVTVDFGLKNNGTATTTSLVATLQPGGGVTSPSGPQNYGSIPPDNTTVVTRPFTFTVDPSVACGSTVSAVFQLQDGADNLGTVTFTLQVGTPGPSATTVYSSGNIAVPIPDNSSVEIPITIPDTGAIQDINARIRLNHTFDGDLVIRLIHPDGTEVILSNNRGAGGDNFGTGGNNCSGTKTVFDDEAGTTIGSGIAPFAGSFRPDNPLSAFDGKPTNGQWKLRISDTAALDVGTVGCLELEITRAQFVCCGGIATPVINSAGSTITAESCSTNNGAVDPGETVTVSLCVQNNGTGPTSNAVGTLLSGGGVTSPSGPQNYGSVPPVGPAVCNPFTFTVDPSTACGGVVSASVQFQDGATNLGTVTYNFTAGQIAVATSTFSNPTPIVIPTAGTATPYPSTINVAGVTGNVSKVTVKLENINHDFPDDIDVLLVGPAGQKILLMSDVGSNQPLVNTTYTFDDAAAANLADGSLSPSGTYKPTNSGSGDVFPGAPAGPYPDPQLLSVFNNVNPNGAWNLYVVDDVNGESGNINLGWTLSITTGFPVCCGGPPGPAMADLAITKSDSPDPVISNRNITYTLNFLNNGPAAATNVTISDQVPSGTTFISATAPAGWSIVTPPVGGTGNVMFSKPSVAVGEIAAFQIVVKVDAGSPDGKIVTNIASVGSSTPDSNNSNNQATTTTVVMAQSDLTISKSHSGNFNPGQPGTYTIVVSNVGDIATSAPVTVTDTLPVGLTPTGPVGPHNGWTCAIASQTVTCSRADALAAGASYPTITITVAVANPAPLNATNTATVAGGGEIETGNNTASDATVINCSPDPGLNNVNPLVLSRFRANGPGGPNDEFVEIHNPASTSHVVATGNCTGGYSVISSAGNGTTSNGTLQVCQIPNGTVIPAGGYYLCTGTSYSLNQLGFNSGAAGATSVGDVPIGCGGSCSPNIPDDAGLALIDVGANIINMCPKGSFGCPTGFNYSNPTTSGNARVYDSVGFGPYGPGAPASGYPSLATNFCEGACLLPVGDMSTSSACTNPTGLFPTFAAAPACYGQAGQYELLRRQTLFVATSGTPHQDTNNNPADFILVAPNSAANMGLHLTGISGVTSVLGAAGPKNSTAPVDRSSVAFTQAPFEGTNQLGPRNAERHYNLDPTIANAANNPLGTFVLRVRFTNNTGGPLTGIRLNVDNLSTLCGPQNAAPLVGSAAAANVASPPTCGTGILTAILKVANSAGEVMVDSSNTAQTVFGTVIQDLSASAIPTPPGTGPLSPFGGGVDSMLAVNPSNLPASLGDGVTGGTGVINTTVAGGSTIRLKFKFGVVRGGRFILLVQPMTGPSPTP